jgi:capsule polysaccharide export protein KpsE/RkpR
MEDKTINSKELPVTTFGGLGDVRGEDQNAAREKLVATLRLLWNRRRTICLVASMGLVLSAMIALLIPKRYTTTTRLMPPDSQSASSMMMLAGMAEKAGSGLGTMAGDVLGLKSSGALFVGMLQSQTIQNRLVQQFDLKKVYETKLLDDARKQLNQNTSIQEDRKSGIITITVTDRSAQRVAALANAYVGELNSMASQLSTSSAHRERVFLEERLQSVKRDLDDAETQLAQFSSKNNTIDIQQQEKAMLEATATLAGQLIAAQSELEGLRQIYTDDNARVRSLNARVGELRKELDKLSGQPGIGQTGNAWSPTLTAADPSPVSSANMPYPSTRNLPLLGVKYADYYRHTKIQETVYELLTEQNELAKVEEAKETPSVKVLDPAEIPERKSYPPRLIIICLGTLISLVLSLIRTIGTTRWREIDPQDQRKVFAQEVMTTITTRMSWRQQNGNAVGLNSVVQAMLRRFGRHSESGAD